MLSNLPPIMLDNDAMDDVVNQARTRAGRPIFRDVSFSDAKIAEERKKYYSKKANAPYLENCYTMVSIIQFLLSIIATTSGLIHYCKLGI